jgi:hypothetical protein
LEENVSDHLNLVHAVYIDACTICVADVSSFRDLDYIKSRIKDEGLSFLTITLPRFCNDFERSLQNGFIDPTDFQGFRKSGSIPAFLQGMIGHVFDKETGRIFNDRTPATYSPFVCAIRQICLLYKKVELPCTLEREHRAIASFIAIEHDFDEFSLSTEDQADFQLVSSVLWTAMVCSFELATVVPRHGPGATSEGASGNQKYNWSEWNDRLEPYFPLVGNGYPLGIPESSEELEKVTILSAEQERPVRVVLVPKTLKSPRVIAVEPSCMQFVQQGIRDWLYTEIESSRWTAGHINFADQSKNQLLALTSSNTGRFATIDLSDASDRVPRSLAMEMFRSNPVLQDAIDACRSTSALLPDGRVISPLKKFASMGSALCFPIEAMYFYTICVVACLRGQNLPITARNIYNVTRGIYVYGDDIIVPQTNATVVLDHLRKYNCKVNPNKTFVNGSFRESCGTDAYGGEQVTPVYLRHLLPKDKRQSGSIISWVSVSNSFYKIGFWNTASFMRKRVERLMGPLPYVSERSSAIGHISYLGYQTIERWNGDLQAFEIKAFVPEPVYRPDELEGYGALLKCFVKLEGKNPSSYQQQYESQQLSKAHKKRPSLLSLSEGGNDRNLLDHVDPVVSDRLHLERSVRRGAVTLKRRWVPALT